MQTTTFLGFTKLLIVALLASALAVTASGAKPTIPGPVKVVLESRADHRFHFSDGYEGHWLWLRSDDTYVSIYRGDTGIVVTEDHGRWAVQGSRLVLDAQFKARDIETPEFDILVQDICGVDMLPELRRRIAIRVSRPNAAANVDVISAIRDGGKRYRCGAITLVKGSSDAPMLRHMLQAIDAYLAHPSDRQRFSFDAYAYRDRTFLVPVDPGPAMMRHGLPDIMAEFARDTDNPQYVYLDVSKQFFEQVDACDFPTARGRCEDLTAAMFDTLVRWFPSLRSQ
jgi:hypothetical protein